MTESNRMVTSHARPTFETTRAHHRRQLLSVRRTPSRCCFSRRFVGMSLLLLFFGASTTAVLAADQPEETATTVRELFVPFDQLPLLLGGENERVFLTREEYEDLKKRARKQPSPAAPVPVVAMSAAYTANVQGSTAVFQGMLQLEVLESGLHTLDLPMSGVQVRQARLDDSPAPLARDDQGKVVLYVQGAGRHQLELELHAPVVVAAAQQSINFRLPPAGTLSLQMSVPGNVEVKSGLPIIRRTYDPATETTEFDFAAARGATSLVMSLNNRRLMQEQVTVARSVLVSELTSTNERLHANVSLDVLHGAVDRYTFRIPDKFQVTHVASPLLAQWAVRRENGDQYLDVRLREPTRNTEVINIAATGPATALDQWSMPKFAVLNTSGSVAVVGVLVESQLRPLQLAPEGLIPIDVAVLRNALPESFFQVDPGTPPVRPVAAYYAPTESFALKGQFQDPESGLQVAMHALLLLDDEQLTLRGGFTLSPKTTKRKSFAFRFPHNWQLEKVHLEDGTILRCDQYLSGEERRCVVTLPTALEPGTSTTVYFLTRHTSSEWLGVWKSTEVSFPRILIEQASNVTGALAVQTQGDLQARPTNTTGLTPLDSGQRSRFGLGESDTELTFRFDQEDYSATFRVERIQPTVSSRNFSFFQISNGALTAHYEVFYTIDRAHTRRLLVELPTTTPTNLEIRGLDNVQLKEFSLVDTDNLHRWEVLLTHAREGAVRLAVDFQQKLEDPQMQDFVLPVIQTGNTAYQTQMVAIEGDPALDISITTELRPVDVGELVEAEYMPGARLLGTFASTDASAVVSIDAQLRNLASLPAAIVERAELVTQLSPSGVRQSAVRYQLRTKVPFLTVQLPQGAELWSTTLNGKPRKPRRRGDSILLSVQPDEASQVVDLQIAYETRGTALGWLGHIDTTAPRLSLGIREDGTADIVPHVDLVWRVVVPAGYRISRSRGTVTPDTDLQPTWPVWTLAQSAAGLAGGSTPYWSMQRARMARLDSPAFIADEATSFEARDLVEARDHQSEEILRGQSWRARGNDRRPLVAGRSAGEAARAIPQSREPQAALQPAREENGKRGVDPFGAAPPPPPTNRAGGMYGSGAASGGYPGTSGDPFGMPNYTGDADGMSRNLGGMAGPGAGMGGGMAGMGGMMGGAANGPAGRPAAGEMFGDISPDSERLMDDREADVPQERAGEVAAIGSQPQDQAEFAEDESKRKLGSLWALQGLRGLTIQIEAADSAIQFRSLGADPTLQLTLFDQQRMAWLSWAVAAIVMLGGLLLVRSPIRRRIVYAAVIALLAAGLPLLGGPFVELTEACEQALFAAALLVPFWVACSFLALMSRAFSRLRHRLSAAVAASICLFMAGVMTPNPVSAQDTDIASLLKALADSTTPVKIPEDAVVIPYDVDDTSRQLPTEKVLVPYEQYQKLWRLAYAEDTTNAVNDSRYSVSAAQYETVLDDDEFLVLRGKLSLELFGNQQVEIPLALSGAMITSAALDGQPAKLRVVQPQVTPPSADGAGGQSTDQTKPPAAQVQQSPASTVPVLALIVQGQGQHDLELVARVAIERQGGWRRVQAVLPHAPASSLQITVPQADSQLRRSLAGTSLAETTVQANQVIQTVLESGGQLELAWRPKISPGSVDQSLTTLAHGIVDLQEDGIHAVWQLRFEFGQTERGTFQVSVPTGYLVEKVTGDNVRGWDVASTDENSELNIELLKPVKGQEQVTIQLSRMMPLASEAAEVVSVPYVGIPEAALNQGFFLIRRSPRMEVTTTDASGATRTDRGTMKKELLPTEATQKNPLGIQDYQAFRFSTVPFQVAVRVKRVAIDMDASWRTLVRVGETESALECELELMLRKGRVYRAQIELPEDFQLEEVTCRDLSDWSITKNDGKQILHIFLSNGHTGRFPITLRGTFPEHESTATLSIPQLMLRAPTTVREPTGIIVFQIDPSLEAALVNLENCQPLLLERATTWLLPEQRPSARLAVGYRGNNYAGELQLTPARSFITVDSFTNVRLTYREIQETILLDFQIHGAGVRQFRFRLPADMRNAEIQAPLIRQMQVEDAQQSDQVQVTLDLQDAVTGDYRVVVQQDRALKPQDQTAPFPWIDTGSARHRYLTLENNGRDEVVIERAEQLEPVDRTSRQWQLLTTRLRGGDFTTAYVARPSGAAAEFVYSTKRRELLKTVGANIGLTRTTLVLDRSGAYRAAVLLKVDNRTEPYLEIELPAGARLWSAFVADRPVKPARPPAGSSTQQLRIPLVKTAEGDLDYPVVLKYGGRIADFQTFSALKFPFIRTVNIHVERSQVKLLLPESLGWYHFTGNLVREQSEKDFVSGYVAYRSRQLEGLTQILSGKNDFSKARASMNAGMLLKELSGLQSSLEKTKQVDELQTVLDANTPVVESANAEIESLDETHEDTLDNRDRLNLFFSQQQSTLSRNRVTKLGNNFAFQSAGSSPAQQEDEGRQLDFDQSWFFDNGLAIDTKLTEAGAESKPAAKPQSSSAVAGKALQERYAAPVLPQQVQQQNIAPEMNNAAQNVFQNQVDSGGMGGYGAVPQTGRPAIKKRGLETQRELSRAYRQKQERTQQHITLGDSSEPMDATRSRSSRRGRGSEMQSDDETLGFSMNEEAQSAAVDADEPTTGWASLDFELPVRGTEFYFSTPGGDLVLQARPIDRQMLTRGSQFLGLLLGFGVILSVLALARVMATSQRALIVTAVLLCLVGTVMTILLVLPLAGLVLLMGGILIASQSRRQPTVA
jgi:hypothetical protein